ncbi:L2 protein [Iotapapillomavirus 1]|uniref:Minor capsid protein L2 n=1 Tax=Mastomys natalensis papillomavirus (isolate African multimammate rat) TaxID=654915 RepID=Q84358_MNPVA|nr:L2 protein [Iotapapillomavirus 1]AAA67148.1 L2 protein [Iotapapillomavirus 1]
MSRRRKRHTRVPRDSATHIYQTCKQAGTCPPDVVNKVEGTTTADKILQYGGAAVFLGGLGIGTGRGSGGATGYVPVGETPGISVGARPVPRPNVPLETVGPQDLFPVDAIRPTDPSVIDVASVPTPTDTSINVPEVEVIAEIHPVPPDGPSNTPTTTINTSGSGDAAILEVAPEPSPAVRTRWRASKTTFHNPAFHSFSSTGSTVGEATGMDNIVVYSGSGGRTIGGDSIELMPFTSSDTLDLSIVEETSFGGRTSTPRTKPLPSRLPSRRYYEYRESSLGELWSPRRAMGPTYINPAFEAEDSILFPECSMQAANPDYTGITRLGHLFGTEQGGRVRIGRLGQKTSLHTRSGMAIGPKAYFYKDISSISVVPEESIELSTYTSAAPLGEDAGIIVEDSMEGSFDNITLSSWSHGSMDGLLEDDASYDFHGHLVWGTRRSSKQISMPFRRSWYPETAVYVQEGGSVMDPEASAELVPSRDSARPHVIYRGYNGTDYYLHPSLSRRRRNSRHIYFSDGVLAA